MNLVMKKLLAICLLSIVSTNVYAQLPEDLEGMMRNAPRLGQRSQMEAWYVNIKNFHAKVVKEAPKLIEANERATEKLIAQIQNLGGGSPEYEVFSKIADNMTAKLPQIRKKLEAAIAKVPESLQLYEDCLAARAEQKRNPALQKWGNPIYCDITPLVRVYDTFWILARHLGRYDYNESRPMLAFVAFNDKLEGSQYSEWASRGRHDKIRSDDDDEYMPELEPYYSSLQSDRKIRSRGSLFLPLEGISYNQNCKVKELEDKINEVVGIRLLDLENPGKGGFDIIEDVKLLKYMLAGGKEHKPLQVNCPTSELYNLEYNKDEHIITVPLDIRRIEGRWICSTLVTCSYTGTTTVYKVNQGVAKAQAFLREQLAAAASEE